MKHLLLYVIAGLCIWLLWMYNNKPKESFGNYPESQTSVLLKGYYPLSGHTEVGTKNESQMYKHYPVFPSGSYTQITNNFKHQNNPDIAKCMPDNFCGVLYKDKEHPTNIITQLPPVETGPNQRRVGFFSADIVA